MALGATAACSGTHTPDNADSAPASDAAADALDASTDPGPDGGAPDASARAPLPQIANQGGRTLTHLQLVGITFADDANRAAIEAFDSWLVTSDWYTQVVAEYGLGAGTLVRDVELADNAPTNITNAAIASFLVAGIQNGTLPAPPDPLNNEYLYVVHYPVTTTVTLASGAPSCQAFSGYHDATSQGGLRIAYAVIPTCGTGSTLPGLSSIQGMNYAAAHEIVEAATDPYTRLRSPAYSLGGDPTNPWSIYGGEVADLCFGEMVSDNGFELPRGWSNAAAARGGDPCVPAVPGRAYFNVSPESDAPLMIDSGATATLTLTAWSTATVPSWSVQTSPVQGNFTPVVSSQPRVTNDGGVVTLTVRVPAGTPSGSHAIVMVGSSDDGFRTFDFWPVAVLVN